jgi:ABC-type amino acid transport substrate-binding protein
MWSNIGHPDLNENMIPIPIPADRGVHGYRVFLIRADRQAEFSRIRTLKDLRHFVVGQGANWGDIRILEYNGLPVVTASLYDGLFPMLEAGRFDYFSRSVLEAPLEMKSFGPKYPALVIENSLLLHYRFPVVFFVSKNDPALAKRIEAGMESMVEDGSLKRLFDRYFQKSLATLNLKSRRVIELQNPYLPAFVPVSNRALWFDPLENR